MPKEREKRAASGGNPTIPTEEASGAVSVCRFDLQKRQWGKRGLTMREGETSGIVVVATGLANKTRNECKNQLFPMKAGKYCPNCKRQFRLREERITIRGSRRKPCDRRNIFLSFSVSPHIVLVFMIMMLTGERRCRVSENRVLHLGEYLNVR
jgi:hypothetical protein